MWSQIRSSSSKRWSGLCSGRSTITKTTASWCYRFFCLITMPMKWLTSGFDRQKNRQIQNLRLENPLLWCLMSTLVFFMSSSNGSCPDGQRTHCTEWIVRFFRSFFFIFRNALTIALFSSLNYHAITYGKDMPHMRLTVRGHGLWFIDYA